MLIREIKRRESWIYVILWVIVAAVCSLHLMGENAHKGLDLFSFRDAGAVLLAITPLILLFLLNNYVLIPRYLVPKKIAMYSILASVAIVVFGAWEYYFEILPGIPGITLHMGPGTATSLPLPVLPGIISGVLVVGVNVAVSMVCRNIVAGIEQARLMAANSVTRLQNLRSQISPHFYMNMLNNIHGFVDIDPERAKDMILDMSHLMHYMLYDSSNDRVSLNKEIKFMEDYVKIMERRYPADKVRISLSLPHTETMRHIDIPPLLFLVFIENAFKHGVDYRHDSFVDIKLDTTDEKVKFTIANSIPPSYYNTLRIGGLGLDNVRKRLTLIYGDSASLRIEKDINEYKVTLTLPAHETESTTNR